jgi:hypothetical protein
MEILSDPSSIHTTVDLIISYKLFFSNKASWGVFPSIIVNCISSISLVGSSLSSYLLKLKEVGNEPRITVT